MGKIRFIRFTNATLKLAMQLKAASLGIERGDGDYDILATFVTDEASGYNAGELAYYAAKGFAPELGEFDSKSVVILELDLFEGGAPSVYSPYDGETFVELTDSES